MELSIIIPVFNEKSTIQSIIEKIKKLNLEKQVIVVDDCSTDGTREILKNYPYDKEIQVLFHQKNKGKSSAIRTGLSHVKGEVVTIQDADLEYEPEDLLKLLQIIKENKAEVVYGSRLLSPNNEKSYLRYLWGGKFLTFLANLLYNANITDESTCYKMFKTKVLKDISLKSNRFGFCSEVTAKIRKKGITICEVPIRYAPRKMKQGKKIRWKDGLEAIWILIKYKFVD